MDRWYDERSGQWPTLAKVTEIRPDRLSYIVESDGKEMLCSRAMLHVEKPSFGTDQDQGQVSERRGVSSPASSRETESVRIGKCQNWKVSESESVRIGKCQNQKVSELESVRIGKCQN